MDIRIFARLKPLRLALTATLALAPALVVAQQGASPTDGVTLELNRADPVEAGCRLSLVITNTGAGDIAAAIYETVLFDRAGLVERLTLFDMGALPAGRPRVRQFVVPGLDCAGLGRVLVNGASQCGPAPEACALRDTGSRVAGVEVSG